MITLTNGVQIPENAVQLQTTAAIDGYYVTQPLRLVQYDETLPVAAVQLTYQNQPYTPPTGAELNVRMGKPDGTTVYNPCLGMDSSGIVYFAFTQQMTIVAGTGTLTVEITDSGVKNSAPIIAEIRPNPVPEGAIASTDEFLTLQEILAEAEKWGRIVQTNASNIQQVVDNLEDIQNAAENAQAAAASAAAAQQAAQEALGFRKFYGAVVPDANGNLDPSRPMTVGPAASVEIESAGDRIQSVTALGFTQQAGSGDPSPTNVRQLTNGGPKFAALVLTGDETFFHAGVVGQNGFYCFLIIANANTGAIQKKAVCSHFKNQIYGFEASTADRNVGNFFVGQASTPRFVFSHQQLGTTPSTSVGDCKTAVKAYCAKEYEKGTPITVWYITNDGTGSLYAPIILQGGEYRATCLPLTAPLCEGDSVVSWVKSGCDQVVTFDGSEDESWVLAFRDNGFYIRVDDVTVLPGSTTLSGFVKSTYLTEITSNQIYHATAYGISLYNANPYICVRIQGVSTVSALKEYLADHPLTVWYRSTAYTEAADIPVSLETHQQAVLVLDGTEGFEYRANSGLFASASNVAPGKKTSGTVVCTNFKGETGAQPHSDNGIAINSYGQLVVKSSTYGTDASALLDAIAAQYAAGTPVTIVYQLATPITYAHEAVVLEAATGDQLAYTVTGQSGGAVSVALKPMQDGGHAKTAENATNAITAQTAANSQQLDGLTLLAVKESMTPVGYIFSWAPVDDGPDLSTPAKVAEYFGFGTWAAYGTGQVLVGVDSGQTEFNTPGKTGGEKTNTLTVQEIPEHNHNYIRPPEYGGEYQAGGDILYDQITGTAKSIQGQIEKTGGGQPHNNLQPYITVYRWQRIA